MNIPCQHCGLDIEDSGDVLVHTKSRRNWCKIKPGGPICHAQKIGDHPIVDAAKNRAAAVNKLEYNSPYQAGYRAGYKAGISKAGGEGTKL